MTQRATILRSGCDGKYGKTLGVDRPHTYVARLGLVPVIRPLPQSVHVRRTSKTHSANHGTTPQLLRYACNSSAAMLK